MDPDLKQAAPATPAFRKGSFLPDPEPRLRRHTIISVDDHLIEPPDTFHGRLEKRFVDLAPKVVQLEDGADAWVWEGKVYPQIAIGATSGRPKNEWAKEATNYADIRPACYRADARIKDMDIDGVYASLNFPSLIAGLAGSMFLTGTGDQELGQALIRAWNDWLFEEWVTPYPDRIIPCGLAWLGDPQIAAAEVRRNALRGFKAVSFMNSPANMGLPGLHNNRHWDPFFAACEETETVLCLHAGSDGYHALPPGSPFEVSTLIFPMIAYRTAADWLWGGVPTRFPKLKISLAEGGIAWVPMLLDRLTYVLDHTAAASHETWPDPVLHPTEVLKRNFWFCAIEFSSGMKERHRIGVDNILIETDYPHADSSWPDSQPLLAEALKDVPADEARKISWENASKLFRHPVPAELQLPRGS